MKTFVSDNFPLDKLECQYYDICKHYDPKKCGFTMPCEVRHDLRGDLEKYVATDCLKFQVELILKEARG